MFTRSVFTALFVVLNAAVFFGGCMGSDGGAKKTQCLTKGMSWDPFCAFFIDTMLNNIATF